MDTNLTSITLSLWKSCSQMFLSCAKGALPSIRYDRIQDITADLLPGMCSNVGLEPTLQPLIGERFPLRSTNTEVGARLVIKAQNFGTAARGVPTLMSESSISLPLPMSHHPPVPHTTDTKERKGEHMSREFSKWNMVPLLL